MIHDAIVVGAGPAGATAARSLAQRGLDVLIVEKAKLPRYKTCGGGVTGRAADLLGEQLPDAVVEDETHTVTLALRGRWPVTIHNEKPVVYMTMRSELDYWLTQRAVEAGAKLMTETTVRSVADSGDRVVVGTTRDELQARVLVGADGVHSFVGRHLGLAQSHEKALALEIELDVTPGLLEQHKGSVILDYGFRPNGYAWIFPKRNHLSVGVGSSVADGASLEERLGAFRQRYGLEGQVKLRRGFFLSVGGEPERVQQGRVLLVGDAAGLVDPLFGEGIYYALRSGQLAADVVALALASPTPDALMLESLASYDERLRTEVVSELEAVRRFSEFFYRWPGLFHIAFRVRPQLLHAVMRTLAGELELLEVLPVRRKPAAALEVR